jgi:ABC-type transport system involved in multi-copper enzyme maturation permease subunit
VTWFGWITLAVLITSVAALTGIKPKGTEHLAHTRMLGVARFALLLIAVILGVAYALSRAHAHG